MAAASVGRPSRPDRVGAAGAARSTDDGRVGDGSPGRTPPAWPTRVAHASPATRRTAMGAPAPSGRALQRALVEGLGALGTGRIPELLRLRYAEALEPPAGWRRLGIGKTRHYRSHGRH